MGMIVGRVLTNDGQPIANASAMIGSGTQPHHDIAALTDDNGEFRLSSLEPGEYSVVVNTQSEGSHSKNVKLTGQADVNVEFRV